MFLINLVRPIYVYDYDTLNYHVIVLQGKIQEVVTEKNNDKHEHFLNVQVSMPFLNVISILSIWWPQLCAFSEKETCKTSIVVKYFLWEILNGLLNAMKVCSTIFTKNIQYYDGRQTVILLGRTEKGSPQVKVKYLLENCNKMSKSISDVYKLCNCEISITPKEN